MPNTADLTQFIQELHADIDTKHAREDKEANCQINSDQGCCNHT